ncbi:MAG: hypothetical protein ABEK50_05430 [bacterium]
MIDGFKRNYSGQSPYYEVWYGKVDIAPEQAFWFRYTLLDGKTQEASCWAILFDKGEIVGDREVWDVSDLAVGNQVIIPRTDDIDRFRGQNQVFHLGECHLDESNALGFAGPLSWDLSWSNSGRQFRYVPQLLKTLGLAGSTYNSCLFDFSVSGTIQNGDDQYEINNASGMVGHIEGKKIIGNSWGWAHCNNFDNHPDAAFEGLSAQLQLAGTVTPPLSAFVLFLDGEKYTFRSPVSIIRSQSGFNREQWTFKTSSGGVQLEGRAEAPSDVALVEYTDTDDSRLWCYNSKLADLTLTISDESRGLQKELTSSGRSAYEWVTRTPPEE